MPSRSASKVIAAAGGVLMVIGAAAMAYLEPAITNAAQQGFKGSSDFWLGWADYGLVFVIVSGLFIMLYGLVSLQGEPVKIRPTRQTDATAAA
jgi:hypothetical protein